MSTQQPIMPIDWLLINLTKQFNKKPIIGYRNKLVTYYPIIILKIFKIILPH